MTMRRSRGSILILALWALFFLSATAVVTAAYVRPKLGLASRLSDRTKTHLLARAGVLRAVKEASEDSWSNNEEAFSGVSLGDGFYDVYHSQGYGLEDEERKVNINKASYEALKNFFEIAAPDVFEDAGDIASSIIDWRDADDEPAENGAERGYYATLKAPYPCKNMDFELAEELLLVKGVTAEIFDEIKDRVTVYGSGRVNINTADKVVLRSMGLAEGLAEEICRFRDGPDGRPATDDDNVFTSVDGIEGVITSAVYVSSEERLQLEAALSGGLFCVRSENFRGTSRGSLRAKEANSYITFVCDSDGNIRLWQER